MRIKLADLLTATAALAMVIGATALGARSHILLMVFATPLALLVLIAVGYRAQQFWLGAFLLATAFAVLRLIDLP